MKPEKWVEAKLSEAFAAFERWGVRALARDPRVRVALVVVFFLEMWRRATAVSRARAAAARAARLEKTAREERRARDKRDKAEKKRRRRQVVPDDPVVVADVVAPTPRAIDAARVHPPTATTTTPATAPAPSPPRARLPYMFRLARAAHAAPAPEPEWDYEREYEEEIAWRRDAASASAAASWSSAELAAFVAALRAEPSAAHPTREARFRAVAARLGDDKTWTQCAATFVRLRDEALRRGPRAANDATRTVGRNIGRNVGQNVGQSVGQDIRQTIDDDDAFEDDHDDHADASSSSDASSDDVSYSSEEEEALVPLDLDEGPARGTRVSLVGVSATNVDAARIDALALLLRCVSCGVDREVTLSGRDPRASTVSLWCGGCSAVLRASLRPKLVVPGAISVSRASTSPAGSAPLADVDCVDCDVVDVLPSRVRATCGACDASLSRTSRPMRAPFARGKTTRDACARCGAPLAFGARDVVIERATAPARSAGGWEREGNEICSGRNGPARNGPGRNGPGNGPVASRAERLRAAAAAARSARVSSTGPAVREGTALPDVGRCAHFRRSLRWLRFPCCGRAHPCAECHASSDCAMAGDNVWADRMICGQCSREQRFSASAPCESCGFKMGQGGSKSHWNGGAGMRDRTRLSKKDSRRVDRDGSRKTTSRRARSAAEGKSNKYQGSRNR